MDPKESFERLTQMSMSSNSTPPITLSTTRPLSASVVTTEEQALKRRGGVNAVHVSFLRFNTYIWSSTCVSAPSSAASPR